MIMHEYYLAHPPPPAPVYDELPPPTVFDSIMEMRLARMVSGVGRGESRYGLNPEEVEILRSYMLARQGRSLASMEREIGICSATLKKYGSDLIVR